MPDPIVCPHCHEQLDIPAEYHGRKVRCAACQNIFHAVPSDDTPTVRPLADRRSSADQPPWREPRPSRRSRPDEEDDRRPQSNLGVFVLMSITFLVVGGCCGGLNLVAFTQVNPTMTPYTSDKGKFKVEFPDDSPTEGLTTNPADEAVEGVQVTAARDYGQERYTVKSYGLKPEWRELPADEALEKVANAELAALGVTGEPQPRRERDIKHQGFPALDVYAERGNGLTGRDTLMRCILAGRRVYVVAVQAQKTPPGYWWIRQFFLSFVITDPEAKPPAKKEG